MLLAGMVAGGIVVSPLAAQSAPAKPEKPVAMTAPTTYQADHFAGRAGKYYSLIWGGDSIRVTAAESGELIRFSYRVLGPRKGQVTP
jgi:hypothetical protein